MTSDSRPAPLDVRRAEMPGLGDDIYLNAASITPLPARSRAATQRFNEKRAAVQQMIDSDFLDPPRHARQACADLIGADVSEIALGDNTSFGINLVAAGVDLPPDSTVLVSDREFPANVYPWMHRGYRLDRIPVTHRGWPDVDRILERIRDPDVRLLAISSVQFSTGYRADLDRIGAACRDADVLLVIDAIQSLGCSPLNVAETPVDVVAAGGHKWLCGPLGVGFCYIRREIQDRIRPVQVGWSSMEASQDLDHLLDYRYEFLDDARRYQVATAPLQDHVAFAESLRMLMEIGVDRIAAHIGEILAPLREWTAGADGVESLTPEEEAHRGGIYAIRVPNPESVFQRLRDHDITCSLREGGIRFAPHFYNTVDELRRVVDVLEEVRRSGWG